MGALFISSQSVLFSLLSCRYTVRSSPRRRSGKTCFTMSIVQSSHTSSTFSVRSTIGMSVEELMNSRISWISNALPVIDERQNSLLFLSASSIVRHYGREWILGFVYPTDFPLHSLRYYVSSSLFFARSVCQTGGLQKAKETPLLRALLFLCNKICMRYKSRLTRNETGVL